MFEKIEEFLERLPVTVASGVALVFSFIAGKRGWNLPADPAWISVALSGTPLVILAVRRLFENKGLAKISSALLISMAMVASILIGDLFAAGEVAFIMAIGELLEDYTTDRAKKGLKNLMSIVPKTATRVVDGREETVEASSLAVGDIVRIRPGESVPTDGIVLSGATSVDQSIMTGESLPVDKTEGDSLFCGTSNLYGSVDMRVTATCEDNSLQTLIRMVTEAEERQAPMQRTADKYASIFVPVALLIAVAAYLFTGEIVRAVTVMVVFCPCALVLATPTAIMAAIGQAAKHGVVIKSGEALEKMGKVRTVAFDKTGTLTCGKPQVSDVMVFDSSYDEVSVVSIAASCEGRSEHPLAKAVTEKASLMGIVAPEPEQFSMTVGMGVRATVGGRDCLVGNARLMAQNGIQVPDILSSGAEGKAVMFIACDGKAVGAITVSDVLKDGAPGMVSSLGSLGVKTVLLTGDNSSAASMVAKASGIENVESDLLPADKLERIAKLSEQGLVCMVGDGVNDAPALKAASVGVAMGEAGSDIAVEAADIALVGDDLSKIPYLVRLSSGTLKTIRFGITLSMAINLVAVALSVLGLLNPTTGALVHNAGSCLVVAIAALLYDRKF